MGDVARGVSANHPEILRPSKRCARPVLICAVEGWSVEAKNTESLK